MVQHITLENELPWKAFDKWCVFGRVVRVCPIWEGLYMAEHSQKSEEHARNLLRALAMVHVGFRVRSFYTQEEAREKYLEVYPPSLLQRKIGTTISQREINMLLSLLCEKNVLSKSVTRFLDGPLAKKDVAVFAITTLGTNTLGSMKSKK
jgi:hypothetical protein